MKVQFGGPEHEGAIARTLKACKSAGKIAAIFCTSGAQAKQRLAAGWDMVSLITDTAALAGAMERELGAAGALGATKDRAYA